MAYGEPADWRDKTGDERFYERMIRGADDLYDDQLAELDKGKRDGR